MRNKNMNAISNIDLQKILQKMAIHIHNEAVEIRKIDNIPDGMLKIYADYIVYNAENNLYYAFHYVVHVDNQTERFFIVLQNQASEDEFLDSLEH